MVNRVTLILGPQDPGSRSPNSSLTGRAQQTMQDQAPSLEKRHPQQSVECPKVEDRPCAMHTWSIRSRVWGTPPEQASIWSRWELEVSPSNSYRLSNISWVQWWLAIDSVRGAVRHATMPTVAVAIVTCCNPCVSQDQLHMGRRTHPSR
jgi:hypothetical protein